MTSTTDTESKEVEMERLKRRIMRHIVRREGGDTDMSHHHEYTDWEAVDRFALEVLALVHDVARAGATDAGTKSK